MVDVVVLLQRTLGPLDQLGDAGPEMVAEHGLPLVGVGNVLGLQRWMILILQ